MRLSRTWRICSTVALVLIFDQLSKMWGVKYLRQTGTFPIFEGILHLTYHENTGAGFSMLRDQRALLIAISVPAIMFLIALITRNAFNHKMMDAALSLMLGGALGNFVDRVRMGYVVDFIDFRIIRFPIFNIADCALTLGAALMILHTWLEVDSSESSERTPNDGRVDEGFQ